jgi:putative membrane protein
VTEPPRSTASPEHAAAARSFDASVELASRRTGMSFQRTRMSADRTLMSVVRTALSLIGFGFTIFQFFGRLHTSPEASRLVPVHAPARFGIALVTLGVLFLVLGIAAHVHYMLSLRRQRAAMVAEKLIHGETPYPLSLTLVMSVLLLLVGLTAIAGMVMRAGPFG